MVKCLRRYLEVILWGVVLSCVSSTSAWALNFYQARVPVADQSKTQQRQAAKEGLRQVLVRVSGSMDIDQSPELAAVLGRAETFIDQFQYDMERNQWGDKQEILQMTFSPPVIERLLRDASLPFWPVNRPQTLLWLVKDDIGSGKQFVTDAEDPLLTGLRNAADQRGIPLRLPLLDLDDQLAISAENVWALDEQVILDASERYKADTVLVGRYTQTSSGQWWATWQFFHRGEQRTVDFRADDPASMGMMAISPLADYLAGLYAVVPNLEGAPQYVLQVNGIEDFAAYRSLLGYLKGVAVVTQFNLVLLADSHLLVTLQLNGDLEQFNNAISLDRKLQDQERQVSPTAPWIAVPHGTADQPLQYQWIGG